MKQEQEFQYMLAELETKQSTISRQIERFEQLANLYLTGVTAIGGAFVVITTSVFLGRYTGLASALTLLAFAGFGTSIYLRMFASKVGIAAAYASRNSVRLYFEKRFPKTAHLVENISSADRYHVWKKAVFSKQVISLFTIINVSNGLSFSLAVGILIIQLPIQFGFQPLALSFVVLLSALVFFLFEILLWFHMYRQMSRARRLNKEILDVALSKPQATGKA